MTGGNRATSGYEQFPLLPVSLHLSSIDRWSSLPASLCELTSFLICCRAPHLIIALS